MRLLFYIFVIFICLIEIEARWDMAKSPTLVRHLKREKIKIERAAKRKLRRQQRMERDERRRKRMLKRAVSRGDFTQRNSSRSHRRNHRRKMRGWVSSPFQFHVTFTIRRQFFHCNLKFHFFVFFCKYCTEIMLKYKKSKTNLFCVILWL